MTKPNNSNTKRIWLSVLVLFIAVVATTIAIAGRLNDFLVDDSGAIPLIPPNSTKTTTTVTHTTAAATTPTTQRPTHPGFEAGDDKTVWSTDTMVEIFRVSYENGQQVVNVQSSDGDKLIAPGTENTYIFKLKNTGDVALDYTVEVDAFFTPADIEIPVTCRLSRYDGTWVVGGEETYAAIPAVDAAEDSAILGAGKYTYYTLDWRWPFEGGNDQWDTQLGNLATERELLFTIVIKTTATVSRYPDDDSGIAPPQTGERGGFAQWMALAVGGFAVMLFLLFYDDREKRRESAEAEKQ